MPREHGVYRFEATVPRDIWIVVPLTFGAWSTELQTAFVEGIRQDLEEIAKQKFQLKVVTVDFAAKVAPSLQNAIPSTCLVVFDEREFDGAAYYLLSEELDRWRLKRVTRGQLERCWKRKKDARDEIERRKAERAWKDMIFHTVLDVLDQMGAVPYRIDSWPYEEACLAIDVSEERRFCAVSFLLCREREKHAGCDGFWRYVESWSKADTSQETINPVRLEDRIAGILDAYPGSRFSPMGSLLVLRDGHKCGGEPVAIDRGLERWMKRGALAQSAAIDVMDYHKKTVKDLRMWNVTDEEVHNVLEGRAIYLDDAALVCLTGAATVGRNATVDPCLLVGRNGANVRRAAQAVFALSQHNYLSPKKAHQDAQPMRDADHELKRRMAMEVRGLR